METFGYPYLDIFVLGATIVGLIIVFGLALYEPYRIHHLCEQYVSTNYPSECWSFFQTGIR